MRNIQSLVLAAGLLITPLSLLGFAIEEEIMVDRDYPPEQVEPNLGEILDKEVSESIEALQKIPGVSSDEFLALQKKMAITWATLVNKGVIEVSGEDKEVRPSFVALQGVVEQVLASGLGYGLTSLTGVIHTPMPATPLCTAGELSRGLVDSSIENDPARAFTVKARTTILRDYLAKGGRLYVVYPKEGLMERTATQRKIYEQELSNYPDRLINVPLDTKKLPTELIGATYIVKNKRDETFVFAIKITQAKDPRENGDFGLWFGPIGHPDIQERLQAVSHYLEDHDCDALKRYVR